MPTTDFPKVAPATRTADFDPFEAALHATLVEMPYNSATEYHRVYGQDPDARLGAACIYQTVDVARRAEALGSPPATLLQDERHVAAVFQDGGDIVVLDPYLLHLDPIRFPASEVEQGSSSVEVPAAPVRLDADGKERFARLSARYTAREGEYVIRLSYSRFSPTKNATVLSRHFSLRSSSEFVPDDFARDMKALLTHPEQTSVSVRAVSPDLRATTEAILPLHGFAERDFRADDIWLRSGQGAVLHGSDDRAATVWRQLETSLALDSATLSDHLIGAARIYQQIADPTRAVAPYSLDDE
ncbi:hypothetical protein J7I98_28320 [Streptomyces sp. ISL-98]|uniref:hypothetical protein n=1 Tax=Streptomyces sp. ISL-98 TaxID=2819192 RepID=UPI001BEB3B1A|nr:hypothetical protein [Streptomyces sp. ISL-98]MBT2509710.1 hypothetical protein [Streptomyces sp. ISL-98]